MGTCVIFCAAGFDGLVKEIEKDDYILAADGGLAHTEKLGLKPNCILGDFDSLGYEPVGSDVFPVEKDDTDAMLAIKRGLRLGYEEFLLYGSLDGKRLDHTVANFQALQYLQDHGAKGTLVGLRQIVTLIQRERICFPARFEGDISVFCMGSDARGVTIENLHYNVQDAVLTAGFPLGVSNHFVGKAATIEVTDGSLLVLWDRANGLPERGAAHG